VKRLKGSVEGVKLHKIISRWNCRDSIWGEGRQKNPVQKDLIGTVWKPHLNRREIMRGDESVRRSRKKNKVLRRRFFGAGEKAVAKTRWAQPRGNAATQLDAGFITEDKGRPSQTSKTKSKKFTVTCDSTEKSPSHKHGTQPRKDTCGSGIPGADPKRGLRAGFPLFSVAGQKKRQRRDSTIRGTNLHETQKGQGGKVGAVRS